MEQNSSSSASQLDALRRNLDEAWAILQLYSGHEAVSSYLDEVGLVEKEDLEYLDDEMIAGCSIHMSKVMKRRFEEAMRASTVRPLAGMNSSAVWTILRNATHGHSPEMTPLLIELGVTTESGMREDEARNLEYLDKEDMVAVLGHVVKALPKKRIAQELDKF